MAEHPDDPTREDEPGEDAPAQSREARKRSRWLAAALVGAAAPAAVVPVTSAAAATPAQVPTATHSSAASAARAAVPAAASPEQVVTVARGDTVGAIAARTGTTVAAIVEANGLDARASITAGEQLRIPRPGTTRAGAGEDAAAEYVVRAGDTLSSIALAQSTTIGALRDANGLDARGFIREGQVLKLSGSAARAQPTVAAPVRSGSYTVRAGDTLSQIAVATGTTVDALVEANDLDRRGFIVEGQVLHLGAGSTRSTAPAQPAAPPASAQANSLAEAVAANRARLAGADLPGRERMREIIRSTAVRLGVDPSLALAIGYQESGFNMRVVSGANAIGAMQVIPTSGEWASDLLGEDIDLFDPADNAKAGVAILRTLVANNPPDVAIASYYQGQGSVRSRGMYDDTRRYVANVQTLQARFS